MKYQQISVDFVSMMSTAWSYLALAGAAWLFLRLIQACFWLPRHLQRQNNVQRMLQDKDICFQNLTLELPVENYEKYILECENNEKMGLKDQGEDADIDTEQVEKWKERRECLAILKKELSKIRDGSDEPLDWDYLLKEDEEAPSITEVEDDEISKDGGIDKLNTKIRMTKQTVDVENKKKM